MKGRGAFTWQSANRSFAVALTLLVLVLTRPASAQDSFATAAPTARALLTDTVHVAAPTGDTGTDRASILAALGEVRSGGTLQFAPGTYLVGEVIRIETPGLTLLGHADGTTLRGCNPDAYEQAERDFASAAASAEAAAVQEAASRCGTFELTGGDATVRGFTFEYSRMGVILGCCQFERMFRNTEGGYLIEGNTFRRSLNGMRPFTTERTVIRGNRFVDTFHAISGAGSRLHVLDNEISAPEPERVPVIGHPSFAVALGPLPRRAAVSMAIAANGEGNVIAGNSIEGHPDGIFIAVPPGTRFRDNVIRDNTIVVERVPFPPAGVRPYIVDVTDEGDSTIVGIPLSLYPVEGPPGSRQEETEEGMFEDNLIEGNRLVGAEGTAIAIRRGSRNRIVGNTFQDIAAHAIVLDGDSNRVELRSASDSVREMGIGNRVVADTSPGPPQEDPWLWLEEIDGERATGWVRARNAETLEALASLPVYDSIRSALTESLGSTEAIPYPSVRGAYLYDFRRDVDHQRGIWRRTTPTSFLSGEPDWEVVLDIDSLATAEGEPWVFLGTTCLPPEFLRCMVGLSRSGGDAFVAREFDAERKRFVDDGFFLPEGKHELTWKDENTLFVAPTTAAGAITRAGYPRIMKVWDRGADLADTPVLFEAAPNDMLVSVLELITSDGTVHLLRHRRSFIESDFHLIRGDDLLPLELPADPELRIVGRQLVIGTTNEWSVGGRTYRPGSLLAIDIDAFVNGSREFAVVFEPEEGVTVEQVRRTRDLLLVNLLRDVRSELHAYRYENGAWFGQRVPAPELGTLVVRGNDEFSNTFLFTHESFLHPPTLYAHLATGEIRPVDRTPDLFSVQGLVERQLWATSKDGTRVPYFIVGPGGEPPPGGRPTVLTAYGGFGQSELAQYHPEAGPAILERGVTLVVANIRGGGEFGASWHDAGRRANRQNAYDDFIAVAEDLIRRGLTSPDRLAIRGASNSGLLVGVAITQRPELFAAGYAGVPLFDMRRYTRLLAGASWIAEYGDPDDPEEWAFLQAYSPYHNLSADAGYPPLFIKTRRHDDRVHPGHARKMAAKMRDMGHDVLFFEATTGGHGTAETIDDVAADQALEFAFLLDRLGVAGRPPRSR